VVSASGTLARPGRALPRTRRLCRGRVRSRLPPHSLTRTVTSGMNPPCGSAGARCRDYAAMPVEGGPAGPLGCPPRAECMGATLRHRPPWRNRDYAVPEAGSSPGFGRSGGSWVCRERSVGSIPTVSIAPGNRFVNSAGVACSIHGRARGRPRPRPRGGPEC